MDLVTFLNRYNGMYYIDKLQNKKMFAIKKIVLEKKKWLTELISVYCTVRSTSRGPSKVRISKFLCIIHSRSTEK